MQGSDTAGSIHLPVLEREVLEYLSPRDGGTYVDCTVNGGGHAEAILDGSAPGGRLIGLDADPGALAQAWRRLARFGDRLSLVHANFRELGRVVAERRIGGQVNGILFDLGLSSNELEQSGRGFSFQRPDEPLDMRFDPTQGPTAADLLNGESPLELERIIREYGEEYRARRVAHAIVERRRQQPLENVADLLEVVARSLGPKRSRLHPATRVFQALRIATNDELGALDAGLRAALEALREGGRIVVVAFHSLEDRLVKWLLREHTEAAAYPRLAVLTRKPLTANREEALQNPRARSAKLRAAERI